MIHHICIYDDYIVFDKDLIPFGKHRIERESTKVINEVLDTIVHHIGKDPVFVCGRGDAKRMLGRKLEDRLKREVKYK